jgi:hypothetical protein
MMIVMVLRGKSSWWSFFHAVVTEVDLPVNSGLELIVVRASFMSGWLMVTLLWLNLKVHDHDLGSGWLCLVVLTYNCHLINK